jgi:uncharacterized membrane protein YvlD (DUF360 family)
MAEGNRTGGGEGLSLQTLVVAAGASAVAAIIVSHLWKDGTVIAAAMTPVIVAISKELIARPMESELVRRPVQQVGRLASSSGRLAVPGRTGTRSSGETDVMPPPEERPTAPAGDGGSPPDDGEQLTPIRTYGRSRRRPIHLKVALITGLVAFVIAAAVLTLPELIFGGAISSHRSTTLFGGGAGGKKTDKGKNQQNKTSTQPQQSKQQNKQTTPAAPPSSSTTKPPPTSGPSSTTPQKSPQQTTPQQTSPIPTTPAPAAPELASSLAAG